MASLLFYSQDCKICKSLTNTIKINKLEKYFNMKQIEEVDIEDILIYGIESVPTIINDNFYYEKEECTDFVASLIQYLKYNHTANLIVTSENLIDNEDEKCAICMGSFEVGEKMHTFFCTHKFHQECSITWRKTKNTCPTCNKILK